MRRSVLALVNIRRLPVLMGICLGMTAAQAQSFQGSFEFRWQNAPANTHRDMELLSGVSFKDKAGKVWVVPKGTTIDGASIPPALWSFAGSPFTGNYRRASVIHDHFCDTRTEFASDVHKMFRGAMEADGVGMLERLSKYLAVSAYSVVTGACGKREDSLNDLFSIDDFEGMSTSNELRAQLESFQVDAGNLDSVDARTGTIAAIAQVENPLTFAALTEFRRIPSEQNFAALETAVRAEQPSEQESDELLLLANATVPEGSIALPAE